MRVPAVCTTRVARPSCRSSGPRSRSRCCTRDTGTRVSLRHNPPRRVAKPSWSSFQPIRRWRRRPSVPPSSRPANAPARASRNHGQSSTACDRVASTIAPGMAKPSPVPSAYNHAPRAGRACQLSASTVAAGAGGRGGGVGTSGASVTGAKSLADGTGIVSDGMARQRRHRRRGGHGVPARCARPTPVPTAQRLPYCRQDRPGRAGRGSSKPVRPDGCRGWAGRCRPGAGCSACRSTGTGPGRARRCARPGH